jgi:hypothetical protein
MTEVKRGLKLGERIIATGLLRLRAGQTVKIKQKNVSIEPAAASMGVE